MIRYFSYGSNMLAMRLERRITQFSTLGTCRLNQHDLRFHKASNTNSAKCDAYFTGRNEDFVLGVLYEIDESEKATLDRYEGLRNGYDEKLVSVHSEGQTSQAVTYIATRIDKSLLPFSWYVRHVVEGAKSAGFPDFYIARIEGTVAKQDHDRDREEQELSIYR